MTLQPFTNEQLNYFKFAFVVLNEFPKALRQTFQHMWDNTFGHLPGFQPWDDSIAVRNMFHSTEGGKTKVPTNLSYDEWDCTALFQATIFARSFALPDSSGHHRTLSDLYMKPHKLPPGSFHASVVSPGGNDAETFAMAIDQLRLLRNAFCHSPSSKIDKPTFDQYIQHTKDAIKALGLTSGPVDTAGSLTEADFPIERVRQLEDDIRKELQAENAFLKEDVKDELIGIRSDIAQSNQERQQDVTRAARETKEEIQELKKQWKEETLESRRTAERNIETTNAANQEMNENIVELNRKFDDVLKNKKSATERNEEIHELKKQLELLQEEWKKVETLESKRTAERNIETTTAATQEMNENIAELNRKFDDVLNKRSVNRTARETKEEIQELKKQWKEEALESRRTAERNIETTNAANQEMNENIAELNRKFDDVLKNKRSATERNEGIHELKKQLELLQEEWKKETLESKRTAERNIETATAANQEMNENIAELNRKFDDVLNNKRSESKPILPRSCLPPKVPHFTGREKECDEIVGHVTSESTRLVSVWGSPGFGKTSIAITVGHELQSQGLPVSFLSLRGLKSKSDLTSKFLGLFRQSATLENEQLLAQRLSADDELCSILDELSDRCVFIIDNADDLFECGTPNVKEEVINLIGEILNRSDKVTFLLTTRESIGFLDLRFPGHQAVRIRELDELSSQHLVQELLSEVSTSECKTVTQICGNVPLAIKLLCSSISEDCPQCVDEFMESTDNIVEMLDNPDYPSSDRLKSLFDASYQRLSTQEKEALVSLCILSEQFDLKIAAAILGIRRIEATKMLQRLQRKSLIDSSSNSEKFSIHKLLQSFAREKGELEMKETVLNSKTRFYEFYIDLFENQTENFLTGHSMSAFIGFFEDEQNIVLSLIDGCLDSKTVDRVFDVLVKAELFLHFLYSRDRAMFDKIYDSAIMAANHPGKNHFYKRLLSSKAFGKVTFGAIRKTKQLFSETKELQEYTSVCDKEQNGKHLCYYGIYHLVIGKIEEGVKRLEEAISSMGTSPEHTILKLIVFQILAFYFRFKNDSVRSSNFYTKALQECKTAGDTGLLVIPKVEATVTKGDEHNTHSRKQAKYSQNQPLQLEVISTVSQAVKNFSTTDTNQYFCNLLLRILKDSKKALPTGTTGTFNYHKTGVRLLNKLSKRKDSLKYVCNIKREYEINRFQHKKIERSLSDKDKLPTTTEQPDEALAENDLNITGFQHNKDDYPEALESNTRALAIALKLFGEEHSKTALSYHSVGITQHSLGDYTSAAESKKRAFDISLKLFGEEHSRTADSYDSLGVTQHSLGDYTSSAESAKRALGIRLKLFGEEHSKTADSYHLLGVTQHSLEDYTAAAESDKRALDIRLKLFGEEHSKTADSYYSLGATQHSLGDYTSAAESAKRALDIRLKLFGEEHAETADSYHSLGVTQHSLEDYTSAAESKKRALDIRLKLFGEEHSKTADSYHSLGDKQHSLEDYTSAAESAKRALDIRLKLFGEEHSRTADSYASLGVTQHSLGDYTSAAESAKRALDIRNSLVKSIQRPRTAIIH